MDVSTLLEIACKARTAAVVASEIGISEQMLSMIKHRKKPCPAWVAGRLAEMTKGDALLVTLMQARAVAGSEHERALWSRLVDSLSGP